MSNTRHHCSSSNFGSGLYSQGLSLRIPESDGKDFDPVLQSRRVLGLRYTILSSRKHFEPGLELAC